MLVKMTIPNVLSLFRIALIPLFVILFYCPWIWAAQATVVLFLLGALTDWLDGYLARKWGQQSTFGAFIDPVADKLMVSVSLVLLVGSHATPWFSIPVVLIICREIAVSALREWMAELGQRQQVSVNRIGQYKTALQMVAIVVLLWERPLQSASVWGLGLGYALLYAAVFLTLWSMCVYGRALYQKPLE